MTSIWPLFHKLWTKAVGTADYNKKEWGELQQMLEAIEKRKKGEKKVKWEEVLSLARRANDHYSLTEREQHLLWELVVAEVPGAGLIVELGVCHGKTAVVLACAAEEIGAEYIGVDDWSLEGGPREVEELLKQIPDLDGRAWGGWSLSVGSSHDESFREEELAVNFLLIDAGHDEINVTKDCEVWIPKVAPGGLVAFDDVPSGLGWEKSAHHAVREQMEKWTGDWEWAASWGKLVVRRKPLGR